MTIKKLKELIQNCNDTDEVFVTDTNNTTMIIVDCVSTEKEFTIIVEEK